MAETVALRAEMRTRRGTGGARATRRAGRVPAVIYGNKEDPIAVSIDGADLTQHVKRPGFFAHVFEVTVNGESYRVLARELQVDPVTDRPLHVDFMRFGATTKVNVDVAVVFENEAECPGIRKGGVLNVVRHAVELRCSADGIPESIAVDLTGLEIGDSVHISDVALPADVEPTIADRDFTIATIAAPTVYVEAEEAEEGEEVADVEAEEALEKPAETEVGGGGETGS